jgi:hypothetical protein
MLLRCKTERRIRSTNGITAWFKDVAVARHEVVPTVATSIVPIYWNIDIKRFIQAFVLIVIERLLVRRSEMHLPFCLDWTGETRVIVPEVVLITHGFVDQGT